MKTEKTYKGFKLVTYKEKNGGYTTYVFNGGFESVAKYFGELKKHSTGIAESACDYNDFGGGE